MMGGNLTTRCASEARLGEGKTREQKGRPTRTIRKGFADMIRGKPSGGERFLGAAEGRRRGSMNPGVSHSEAGVRGIAKCVG